MTETAEERYERVCLPKLQRAVDALEKFKASVGRGERHYKWNEAQAHEAFAIVQNQATSVGRIYGIIEAEKEPSTKPEGPQEDAWRIMAWAYDKLRTGRIEEAKDLLHENLKRRK